MKTSMERKNFRLNRGFLLNRVSVIRSLTVFTRQSQTYQIYYWEKETVDCNTKYTHKMIKTNGTAQSILNTVFIVNETSTNVVLCCTHLILLTGTSDVKWMAVRSLADVFLLHGVPYSLHDAQNDILFHSLHANISSRAHPHSVHMTIC